MRFWNSVNTRDIVRARATGVVSPFTRYGRACFSPTTGVLGEDTGEVDLRSILQEEADQSPLMDLNDAASGLAQDISVSGINRPQRTALATLPSYAISAVTPNRELDNTSTLAQTRQFCVAMQRDLRTLYERIIRASATRR